MRWNIKVLFVVIIKSARDIRTANQIAVSFPADLDNNKYMDPHMASGFGGFRPSEKEFQLS
jgi:hypothetical protein